MCYSNTHRNTQPGANTMTITTKTIKFLGQRVTVYQVCKGNEVVQVCATQEQAQEWIGSNK